MNQARPFETIDENSVDVAALRRAPTRSRPRRRYRGFVVGGLVAAVLLLFVSVVWFAYQDMMPGGDEAPPVVRAEAGPLKRAPNERGGAPVVNEESVVVQALNEPDAPVRVERLIPREEPAPRSSADVIPDELQAEPAAPGKGEPDSLDALLADLAEGPKELRDIEPGDGGAASATAVDELPAAPAPAAAAVPAAAKPPAATAAPAAEPAPEAPAPAVPAAGAATMATPAPAVTTTTRPPAPQPAPSRAASPPPARSAAPAPARTQTATATAPAASGELASSFRLQLLAVRDEAAAAAAWTDLQRKHPAVLGGLRSRVEQAKVGGNTVFRLQAGPFAGREAADRACRSLQQAGGDCFIVGPTS